MQVQPYLFFDGRCEEAITFYRQAIGAEVVMLMRYADGPDGSAQCPDGTQPPADKVMHACLQIGASQVLVSDGFCGGQPKFDGFSLALTADDDVAARRLFDALADGGQVQQPLMSTFFASSFGMLADRFGVAWMVLVPSAPAG
ncbi:VOC family protein [Rhodanobacter sp. B2A1Ga4]|uniref:VOC family protein n=1 Tax=Rhodanobacter sp. B2A1Ga4 TaxID=2778647 RepID=UPI001B399EC6|nr:VOC family protein [Rhodanobacter sp. B2A1Ga4]MBQ4853904.1 VOC family protein [Rhodanobacter sp. B2A1Ga4]